MLSYSFENIRSDSLYTHLYKCIKNDIVQKTIKPDEKLPSKRDLAKNLGISVITVENAYEQLKSEGYIYSLPKKGFYAANLQHDIPSSPAVSQSDSILQAPDKHEYFADFSSNRAVSEMFPFSVWSKLLRQCMNDYQESLLICSPGGGTQELRCAISNHLKQFRGMNVSPEQIIIGAGTEYLYGQIVQLLGHDKIFGVEDPGYYKTAMIYKANAANVKYIRFESDGISISDLENENVDVAHTSPSHQFPTGIVTPISKRYELLGWASKSENRYIIEDDYDSEFRMTGKIMPTLQSIDTIEKVIYLNTFSKSIAPTLRISYMVLPKHLADKYRRELSFYTCPVTNMIQFALAKFIDDGYFEKHINRMRNYYRKQRDLLLSAIKESSISEYITISEADSGLHLVMHMDISCSDEEFIRRLDNSGIRICSLAEYYHDNANQSEHDFVLNYSSLSERDIRKAVEIISREIISVITK